MQVAFLNQPIESGLLSRLRSSEETRVAVAFLKSTGFDRIRGALLKSLRRGGKAWVLVGTGFALTDSSPLRELLKMSHDYPQLQVRVFENAGSLRAENFHPKLYIFSRRGKAHIVLGSSNLTLQALNRNVEANVDIAGALAETAISSIIKYFERLWNLRNAELINAEFIYRYSQRKRVVDRWRRRSERPNATARRAQRQARQALRRTRQHDVDRSKKHWIPPDRLTLPATFREKCSRIPRNWIPWTDSDVQYKLGLALGQTGSRRSVCINTRGIIADLAQLGFVEESQKQELRQIRLSRLGQEFASSTNGSDIFTKGVLQCTFEVITPSREVTGVSPVKAVLAVLDRLEQIDGQAGAYLNKSDFRYFIVWMCDDRLGSDYVRTIAGAISNAHRTGRYPSDSQLGIDEQFPRGRHMFRLLGYTDLFQIEQENGEPRLRVDRRRRRILLRRR